MFEVTIKTRYREHDFLDGRRLRERLAGY